MIEECVPIDRRLDDFYERFLEQWIQQLNNSEQPSMEDSLPFPIGPLRRAPVAPPQKQISNTSSDCGVNFLHVLSPAGPIITENSQPFSSSIFSSIICTYSTYPSIIGGRVSSLG